jgi:hypothetical protein
VKITVKTRDGVEQVLERVSVVREMASAASVEIKTRFGTKNLRVPLADVESLTVELEGGLEVLP